jgi:glutamine amidotransferase
MQVGDLRLPHMGWNTVTPVADAPLFKGIDSGSYFYFVHSFAVAVSEFTMASCQYGMDFSAAIHKDNFFGVQFHPERSSDAGAHLLNNFIDLLDSSMRSNVITSSSITSSSITKL